MKFKFTSIIQSVIDWEVQSEKNVFPLLKYVKKIIKDFKENKCIKQIYLTGEGPVCPTPSKNIIFFPYDLDCHKYYECFAGRRFLMECPSDLYWNQTALTCDYKCGKS